MGLVCKQFLGVDAEKGHTLCCEAVSDKILPSGGGADGGGKRLAVIDSQ